VIWKGKRHQESWYSGTTNDDVLFAVSDNGWTNSNIALQWLQQDFDPKTKSKANRGYRLLLIDGHSSHTTYEFFKFCLDNKIIPFCMPSHSTHHLQPLDVGIFGPYQHYYGEAIDNEIRLSHGILNIGKHNFWSILQQARVKTFNLTTIASGWRKSGLLPFNPRVVYSLLPGEHTPEPTKPRSSPISPTTPQTPRSVRKIPKKVIGETSTSPQRRNAKKLSSTVEKLLVANAIMRQDLLEVKEALKKKPTQNKRKLAGAGVFTHTDLNIMKEDKEQRAEQLLNRRKRPRTSRGAQPLSRRADSVDAVVEEVEDAIVVAEYA
jgi:hypothetical protein